MRSTLVVFAIATAILAGGSGEAKTLFTSDQWEVSSEVLLDERACVLTYTGTKFDATAIAIKGNYSISFNFPNWNFRRRLAPAALTTGEVLPAQGGGFLATGIVIFDPHSAFEGDQVYLEVGWQDVPEDLMEMSKSKQVASLIDGNGKILLKWSLKNAQKPLKVWSDCADRL